MGGHDHCSVAGCDNDKRRPTEMIQRGHVQELIFHRVPKDEKSRAIWISQLRKGLANFEWGQETRVCSNHFQQGKPTCENPYPTLFLCPRDFTTPSPKIEGLSVERFLLPQMKSLLLLVSNLQSTYQPVRLTNPPKPI